jgi:uncharacterized protein YuzB (UPF0349 family)
MLLYFVPLKIGCPWRFLAYRLVKGLNINIIRRKMSKLGRYKVLCNFTCLRPCGICTNNDFSTVNNTSEKRKYSEKMRTRQDNQDVN